MKVLMFGWEFPPHISGGLGTACYGLTKGLVENDTEVVFVMPKAYGDEDTSRFRIVSADGMPVNMHTASYKTLYQKMTYWEVNSLIIPYLSPEEFQLYSEGRLHNTTEKLTSTFNAKYHFTGKYGKDLLKEVWNYARVAAEIVANNTFDVIHVHDWLSFPAGIIAKELSGKPLVAHLHATEFDRSGGNKVNEQIFEIEWEGLHHADAIIAVSELTRQLIINKYGVDPSKVVTIYNAVDDTSDKDPHPERIFKEKIISYVGRVTYQKGPDYFVEAAGKILSRNKNFRFVMAGSGDMLHQVVHRAAELRISSHFHFTGFLKGGEVEKLFAMSDAYVMPSVSEPFGISPLEALRSGVPVIISKQSGVREILSRAICVDFFDVDAMANAIYALANYPSLAQTVVRESRREMQNLKWVTQAAKVKELYEKLVKN